jgi:hypothetical protein
VHECDDGFIVGVGRGGQEKPLNKSEVYVTAVRCCYNVSDVCLAEPVRRRQNVTQRVEATPMLHSRQTRGLAGVKSEYEHVKQYEMDGLVVRWARRGLKHVRG